MARPDTRRLILTSALDCFLAKGFSATSIADIKARSGLSTGSIYHFFESKEHIAQALCAEALGSQARAVAEGPGNGQPEEIVKTMVKATIDWACDHPDQHRFLIQCGFFASGLELRADLIDVAMEARLSRERVLRSLLISGAVRSMPADLLQAQILGPAEAYLREHAQGRTTSLPPEAIALLGEAAWMAVRVDDAPQAREGDGRTDADRQSKPRRAAPKWDLI